MVRRFMYFRYFALQNTVTVKSFCTVKLNSISRTGNPPSAYKQLSSNSSSTGKNRQAGSKIFVYIRVADVGDFSPKKQILGFF
jgi:hypothetical protein